MPALTTHDREKLQKTGGKVLALAAQKKDNRI